MSNKALEHVKAYNEKKGYPIDSWGLYETLTEAGQEVYRKEAGAHRWWNDYFIVVELDGMFIGFTKAENTGDMSIRDAGWEFSEKSVVECVPATKTVTVYEPKKS